MSARMLHPIALPRCEAVREAAYYNDTAATDKQCKLHAKYELEGKNLCTSHAGQVALSILLKPATNEKEE